MVAPTPTAAPDAAELPAGTFTVTQLTTQVQLALRSRFPTQLWVAGEMTKPSKPRNAGGRVFFDLLDRPDPSAPPRAKIAVSCSPQARARLSAATRSVGVRLDEGTPVRLCGRLVLRSQLGRLQLEVTDIDAPWTLGRQIADREVVIAELRAAGLLDANRALALPAMPMRVALITSPGSHAAADFEASLTQSGFGFQVKLFPSLVQGADAPASIVDAFSAVAEHRVRVRWRPDVVVCVRGGGARSDLAAWDDPRVARAIAACEFPVLVAVGHELDQSVADLAAALSEKTPTAAAQWLTDRVAGRLGAVDEMAARAVAALDTSLMEVVNALERAGHRTRSAALRALDRHETAVGHLDAAAPAAAGRRAVAALAVVGTLRDRVAPAAARRLERAAGELDLAEAMARAADPARVLARGFAVVRLTDGTVVRDPAQVDPGAALELTVAAGTVAARAR